jgi:hypothetical protein
MVKLGIKSVPGNNSSTKFPNPPSTPFQPPKVAKKIIEEIGAQNTSPISPSNGTA